MACSMQIRREDCCLRAADDRKRQDASVFVWTQVTCGEHLFAPGRLKPGSQRTTAAHHMVPARRPDPLRHYADLRKALTQYTRQLTQDIDAGKLLPAN
jgi:hypothetical protein